MGDALVHDTRNGGPGTHLLAIGVGRYPHLVGGDGTLIPDHQGLGQLTSPPHSAMAVASWFAGAFHHPQRPLATIRLLVSSATANRFQHPVTGMLTDVLPATIDHVEDAFKAWKQDANSDPDNLPILYFCGHGLASGTFTSLLTESFGEDPGNPMDGAVDFYRNRNAMSSCRAKQQLYLIDACRTDARMIHAALDYAGRVFAQPNARAGTILRPVFYSTLLGQQAFGRANAPSHFAEALIAALEGAGGDRSQGSWRVRTTSLHSAIEVHMNRKISSGLASAQVPLVDELVTFDVHHLRKTPEVPVVVSCAPEEALNFARLRCLAGGAVVQERSPEGRAWVLPLPVGSYDFEAHFDAGPYRPARAVGEYVYPPELQVQPLEVAP